MTTPDHSDSGDIDPMKMQDAVMSDRASAEGLRCTCTPPDGVTRNHANGCSLFDVRAAYKQGREDVLRDHSDSGDIDVERLARALHLARLLPDMDEPYCDNPLTEADLANHMRWAEAILHAVSMLPPYALSTPRTETSRSDPEA